MAKVLAFDLEDVEHVLVSNKTPLLALCSKVAMLEVVASNTTSLD